MFKCVLCLQLIIFAIYIYLQSCKVLCGGLNGLFLPLSANELEDELQNTIGGGKPKMRHHFGRLGWPSSKLGAAPSTAEQRDLLIDALQVLRKRRKSFEMNRK